VIAKMDALKVNIIKIPICYPWLQRWIG